MSKIQKVNVNFSLNLLNFTVNLSTKMHLVNHKFIYDKFS